MINNMIILTVLKAIIQAQMLSTKITCINHTFNKIEENSRKNSQRKVNRKTIYYFQHLLLLFILSMKHD